MILQLVGKKLPGGNVTKSDMGSSNLSTVHVFIPQPLNKTPNKTINKYIYVFTFVLEYKK